MLLLFTALIWGSAFVAQRMGLDHLGSLSFNGFRMMIGTAAVLPIALLRRKRGLAKATGWRLTLISGGVCGVVLFAASNLQQSGILYTSVGKAGFITALYILFVPLIGFFFRRKVSRLYLFAVAVAILGMFLLTMQSTESASRGDLLVLASALVYAVHILVIDHYSPLVDGAMMATVQFALCGVLSLAAALIVGEPIELEAVRGALQPMLYSGLLSCGVGYTLQIVAQKDVNPVVASLLMSLESVFAALAGWLVLGQSLTGRELIGCGLVFAAIVLAQMPQKQ